MEPRRDNQMPEQVFPQTFNPNLHVYNKQLRVSWSILFHTTLSKDLKCSCLEEGVRSEHNRLITKIMPLRTV